MKHRLNIQIVIKYLLSFLKSDWDLTDYPIMFRYRKIEQVSFSQHWKSTPWIAYIANWDQMVGYGATKEKAFVALKSRFIEYKYNNKEIPRPGAGCENPLALASATEIDKYGAIADDFFIKIIGMNYHNCFVSDESSLWDFPIVDEEACYQKIMGIYGIDVSDIKDGNLVQIFARIIESRLSDG